MTTTIDLYRSSAIGFDLDVTRPFFMSDETRDMYFDNAPEKRTTTSTNWNRIGDDMIVGLSFSQASGYDIGRITVDGQPSYYFRVRSIRVNEANRTVIMYDVDWELTYCRSYWNGRMIKCPAGNKFAVSTPVNQRRWKYLNSAAVGSNGLYVALALTQMSTTGGAATKAYNVKGPVYVLLKCKWTAPSPPVTPYDPVKQFVDLGYALPGDIVNAWLVPNFFNFDNNSKLKMWEGALTVASQPGLQGIRYTVGPSFAQWDDNVTIVSRDTDLSAGRISGFCDERGNVIYTVPDMMSTGSRLYIGVRMSMTTCEVDIALNDEGFITSHTCNRMFTYSCKPMDVVCDSWAEYAFRQRASDIESRKLQNEQALAGAGASALTGAATGAVIGSVVPVVGTTAGAVVGGIAGFAMAGVQYGISSHYAGKEQAINDTMSKLSQDTLAVAGAVTSYMIALGYAVYAFTLETDEATKQQIQARNVLEGVDADGFTTTMRDDMKAAINFNTWAVWACDVEVDFAMPFDRKRAIIDTMRAGARWKKFGDWSLEP